MIKRMCTRLAAALMAGAVLAPPAFAQAPGLVPAAQATIEDACKAVTQNLLLAATLHTGVVQSFPELKPPGVRMTYSTRDGVEPKNMVDTIECQFQNTKAPFNIQRFCVSSTCYSPDERNAENKRRFEEVRTILQRAGY
ncbi:hypothetical protein BTR14_15695 [Rhizobium rhizosphaerae]|uniref:Uncharacterized protein n=1 Tax=Xaviernesmea rhizosphaerae TaxID=1672749 RepID=A0ABX3PBH8_9HYPH|nr:hypothetical protein [Xaviernesmea rhizosphaerae]OQP85347.1 hypothetical protein BTR14_15695 [Xaviernesmea rhizosphaerae]